MKLSILLITYNQEKFIEKAIQGILIQRDCPECEIIVSDDHSSDNTFAISKELLKSTPNTTFISNEKNLGITKNYQHSFLLCKGEYIFVIEGDDYWIDPYKIKKQVEFLDNNPVCVMCAHPFFALREDPEILSPFGLNKNKEFEFFDCKDLILDSAIISNFSTCCYRRSILEKISPKTYEVVSYDWMINISVAQFGLVGKLNSLMSVYRIGSTGEWSKLSEKEKLEGVSRLKDYDEILEYKYHDYFEKKIQIINQQQKISGEKSRVVKDYVPTFLFAFAKLIIPPTVIRYFRKK